MPGFETDTYIKPAMRRYTIRFTTAMGSYAVLIMICLPWVKRLEWMPGKIALAVLPLIPVAIAVRELLAFVRVMDELQRRIQFEAVAVAAVITCFGTLAWGLLEKAGLPQLPIVLVTPLFCATYGLSVAAVAWRYR